MDVDFIKFHPSKPGAKLLVEKAGRLSRRVFRRAVRSAQILPLQPRSIVTLEWQASRIHSRQMDRNRILVVDGAMNARLALRELLEEEGYEVMTAADPADALAKALEFRPNVALVDAGLRVDLGQATVLVLMSRDPPRSAGEVLCIRKPVDLSELFSTVVKAAQRSHETS